MKEGMVVGGKAFRTMNRENNTMAEKVDFTALDKLWRASASIRTDKQTQALIGGVNIRLNLAKALKAALETARACISGSKFVASHGTDVLSGLETIDTAIGAASSVIAAVAEKMSELAYVGCMVLCEHEKGVTEKEFEVALSAFVSSAKDKAFSWYTGLSKKRIDAAAEQLRDDGVPALLKQLKKDDFVVEKDEKFHFRPRHFTWGFRAD